MARSSAPPPSTDPPPARFEDTFSRRIAKLRGRILLGAILVVLVLTTLTLTLAWSQYQDGKDEALKDVRARAVLAGTVFDTFFAGQISTLESIAAAPSVTARDTEKMKDYFARVQPPKGTRFTGGLGWLDLKGIPRATSSATTSRAVLPRSLVLQACRRHGQAVRQRGDRRAREPTARRGHGGPNA